MNKEILEKRIERLEGQLKAKDDVIDKLVAYNRHTGYLSSDLADLEYRIDKAIEYIENCNHGTEEYKIYEIARTEVEELLNILKGEENK